MKTYHRLGEQIVSFGNRFPAARGKRRKSAVAEFEFNLEENLF